MKQSRMIFALTAAQAVFTAGSDSSCNADNCLRVVKDTGPYFTPALTSRMSDCSRYQTKTYTGPRVEVTVTKTVTATLGGYYPKRDEEPFVGARGLELPKNGVPAYATVCASPNCYASACSCAGITGGKTTVPGPTATIYTYATVTVCPDKHHTICHKKCYNLKEDGNHCGSCDKKCRYGEKCQQGHCKAAIPGCNYSQKLCYGQCKDVWNDEHNCGKCDNKCKYDEKCNEGKCEPVCSYGKRLCAGKCKNVLNGDTQNCGSCGVQCKYGVKCVNGKCELQCKYGETLCAGKCMVLHGNDNKNCGGCNIICPYGRTCKSGICKSPY